MQCGITVDVKMRDNWLDFSHVQLLVPFNRLFDGIRSHVGSCIDVTELEMTTQPRFDMPVSLRYWSPGCWTSSRAKYKHFDHELIT